MSFNEWKIVKIEDICSIKRGASPRPIQEYIRDSGIPWVKIADATSSKSRFIERTKEFIKEEGKSKSRYIEQGTLILSNSATPGIPKIMKINACVHDGWLIVDDYQGVTKEYMYYMFVIEREKLLMLSNGSVFNNLKTDIVKNYEITLPPLEEQKAIANILSSLDEKIEVNNQINKKLEELAQTIFKQWFVDFEFPNEDGEPYKSSGGAMVESELGMIPVGWEVKQIEEITSIIIDHRGKTPNKLGGEWSDSGYKAISAKNIKNNRIVKSEDIKFLNKDMYDKWMSTPLKEGDVLMTSEAPLGELYYLAEKEEYCLSQRLYGLRSNKNVLLPPLFFMSLNSKQVIENIKNRATGTTVAGIRQSELRKVPIIIPPIGVQKQVGTLIEVLLKKINLFERENEKLKNTRDTLLPKLMSGEIRVPIEE